MTELMTPHRTRTAGADAPMTTTSTTSNSTPTPPSLATTTTIVSGAHLTWLGWTWAATAVAFVAILAIIARVDGELDSSLWQGVGASWQRYVIFAAGVTTLPSLLAMFVSNGLTRAQLSASSTVSMVIVAAAGTTFVIAGYLVESLVFGSAGWPHVVDQGDAVSSGFDLAVVALRFAVLFCLWFSAGWLIGTGFYRYGVVGGLALIVPFAIPVLVGEVLVSSAESSITFDALTGRMQLPAPLAFLVGIGLVVMNATIARSFTRGAAVHNA